MFCPFYRYINVRFLEFWSGFAIIQHFLSSEGSSQNPDPTYSVSVSYNFFIPVAEPVPLSPSANQHCFTVDATCKHVIRGWMLRAQRAIETRSPCVVPSADKISIFTIQYPVLLFSLCTKSLIAVLKDAKQLPEENGGGPFC